MPKHITLIQNFSSTQKGENGIACVSSVKTCVSIEISRSLRNITVHITVHNKTNALYRLSIHPVRG